MVDANKGLPSGRIACLQADAVAKEQAGARLAVECWPFLKQGVPDALCSLCRASWGAYLARRFFYRAEIEVPH